ncbi:hypothetical protein BKA63DRAFT_745 [Paraphoma chrysanthemicola]|nr:hypothetical protein BKA63DRAFT_745 [Paraphoma chrysanthemicola]
MATFQHLPAELRLVILEYLLWSFAWTDPPDPDALNPDEWFYPEQPSSCGVRPVVSFAHRTPLETLVRPLLCVSKQLQSETKYVWKHLVQPNLRHVISFTGVGNGTQTQRPLVCLLVKWLCKPSVAAENGVIEARVRFFDQELGAEGENRTPGPQDWPSLNEGLTQAYWRVRFGKLPHDDALSQTVINAMTTFKIVFESTLPAGLHWTHSETIHYKDSNTKVPISLHPYHNAMAEVLSLPWESLLNEVNRLPLTRCDMFIDGTLVRRFQRAGTVVTEETYPYELPVDPLCVP